MYNQLGKIVGYDDVPRDEMKTILNNVRSAIEGNEAGRKKLLEYVAKGTVGTALIPLGLALGVLFALGLIGEATLTKIVSTVNSRPKIGIIESQPENIENIDEMNSLTNRVFNGTIELVESNKKHHIIDKILDEKIMYGKYNDDGSKLVADIKIIRNDRNEGINGSVEPTSGEKLLSDNENNYHSDVLKQILTEPKPVINESLDNMEGMV